MATMIDRLEFRLKDRVLDVLLDPRLSENEKRVRVAALFREFEQWANERNRQAVA